MKTNIQTTSSAPQLNTISSNIRSLKSIQKCTAERPNPKRPKGTLVPEVDIAGN